MGYRVLSGIRGQHVDPFGNAIDLGDGPAGCELLQGATAHVGFDECKEPYTNYFNCDETEDDVQYQAAYIYVAALGGGEIKCEAGGTYSFTAVVDVTTSGDIWFNGSGYDQTEITQPDGTNLAQFFNVDQNNVHFSRLYLNGNQANNTTTVGIEYTGVTDGRVEFMKIRYMPASGVYAHAACIRIRIIDSVLRDNVGHNAWIQASSDSYVQLSTITGATLSGLFIDNCVGINLGGNQILANVERGINCSISNFVTMNGNIVNGNGLAGIRISSTNASYGKWNTASGNVVFDNSQTTTNTYHGIYLDGTEAKWNDITGNISFGSDQMYGIAENQATENIIEHNFVRGNSTGGLFIGVGTSAHHNLTDGVNTVADGALIPVIQGGFPLSNVGGGATAVTPVINTSPGGVDVDDDDEFTHERIPLPTDIQQVIRIKIWAYSNVIEATNNMLLRIVAHGAGSSELWNGNAVDVANHPSEEEGGIVQYDVLHWVIDASDDAQIGTLAAQDLVELLAVGEPSNTDIATDALIAGYEIEYI